jgi:hypothetical protein
MPESFHVNFSFSDPEVLEKIFLKNFICKKGFPIVAPSHPWGS